VYAAKYGSEEINTAYDGSSGPRRGRRLPGILLFQQLLVSDETRWPYAAAGLWLLNGSRLLAPTPNPTAAAPPRP